VLDDVTADDVSGSDDVAGWGSAVVMELGVVALCGALVAVLDWTVVGAAVDGAIVVGAAVDGAPVVDVAVLGAAVVDAAVLGAAVVDAAVLGATVVGAAVLGASAAVGWSTSPSGVITGCAVVVAGPGVVTVLVTGAVVGVVV